MQGIEVVAACAVILLVVYLSHYLKRWGRKLPPGPLGLPIIGYLPFLDPKYPHLSLTKLAEKYGKFYSIQMGSVFTVVLCDVKLIRQALALDCFSGRAPLYLTHGIMKGNGIICAEGLKWRDQRKFVVNSLRRFGMVKFGDKRLEMEGNILRGVEEMVENIKLKEGRAVDIGHMLMHSVGNVVFNLVFGKTWEEDDETWKKLINLQEEGTKLIGVAGPINFLPFLRFLPKYKNVMSYLNNGIEYSHNIYQKILEEYKNSLSAQPPSVNEEPEHTHFLGAFHEQMSRKKDEQSFYTTPQFNFLMADLWGAGVDTTITTLRWFFLYLAHHQNFQEGIHKEMDKVLGGMPLTLKDISNLPYLQACMSEVQRIRSVTPLGIPHGTIESTNLGGFFIPKGTMIVPLQWAVHMDSSVYQNPDTFDPNRFLDSTGKYVKLESFIPFQTGKRMCLGEEYARMLLFLFGGSVLQHFHISLESPPDFEGEVGITLTPKPHLIKFSLREPKF